MQSFRVLLRSSINFFSGTVLSRVTGAVRDVVMAALFGSHPSVAAFLMAFRFANLPRRLLAEGAMQSALIPTFEELRASDPVRSARLIRDMTLALTLVTVLVVALLSTLCVVFSGPGSFETTRLTLLMLPSLFFIVLYGINASLLQCEKSFFIPSVAPVFFNLCWIAASLFAVRWSIEKSMIALSIGIVIAFAVQWLLTLPRSLQLIRRSLGGFWRGKISPFSQDVRRLARPLLLGILGVGAEQINSALDPIFARIADLSGPAYLWYALRLQQLPLALFGLALSTALLPLLSRAVKENAKEEYQRLLLFTLEKATILMIFCTFAVLATGVAGVDLIYGRGAFTQDAVYQTARCLFGYGVGLLPMTGVLLLAGACYAHGDFRVPAILSALTVLINVGLNATFVLVFHLGSYAIALATSLSAWVHLLLLIGRLNRQSRGIEWGRLWPVTWRITVASSAGFAMVRLSGSWLSFGHGLQKQCLTFGVQAGVYTLVAFVTITALGLKRLHGSTGVS